MRQATRSTPMLAAAAMALAVCGPRNVPTGNAIGISVIPASASVAPDAIPPFTATVTGTANTSVTWSVQEGAAGGTVSAAGLYTASSTEGTYHVVATSAADTTRSAVATIAVTTSPPPPGGTGLIATDR